jgi:anti-sigma factor ChrR (cupin superfamily)
LLNMDFAQRVVIDTSRLNWIASPKAGVWRKPLAREEAERGHATSIVRYDPGASFSSHQHPGGEEILVLEGTFSDETGDFPAGTYFRNPMGFVHAPFSQQGCVILVKLHQFQPGDTTRLCIDTGKAVWQQENGLELLHLHEYLSERVAMIRWRRDQCWHRQLPLAGEELLVIAGELQDESGTYPAGTWLRNPPDAEHHYNVTADTLVWIKTGHLAA